MGRPLDLTKPKMVQVLRDDSIAERLDTDGDQVFLMGDQKDWLRTQARGYCAVRSSRDGVQLYFSNERDAALFLLWVR